MENKKIDIGLSNQINGLKAQPLPTKLNTALWYGRNIGLSTQQKTSINPTSYFYNLAPQKAVATNVEVSSRQYELIDLNDENEEETDLDFDPDTGFSYSDALYHPSEREFAIADQMDAHNIYCKSFLKRVVKGVKKIGKGVKKSGKKVGKGIKKGVQGIGKGVKKGAEEVVDFVKEHKKEVLIGVGVAAAVVGAYAFAIGAFGSAATAPQGPNATNRKKEDENDPDPVNPNTPPPPNDPPNGQNNHPTQRGKIGIMEELSKSLSSKTAAPNPFTPPKGCPPEPGTPYKSAIASFIEQTNGIGNSGGISKSPPLALLPQFDLQKIIAQGPTQGHLTKNF